MYSVWFTKTSGGEEFLFISDIPSSGLAEHIARMLAEEFVYVAWAVKD